MILLNPTRQFFTSCFFILLTFSFINCKSPRQPVQPPYVQYTLEGNTKDTLALRVVKDVLEHRLLKFGLEENQFSLASDSGFLVLRVKKGVVEKPERLRKVLQSNANLRFCETYNFHEISSALNAAQEKYRSLRDSTALEDENKALLFGNLYVPQLQNTEGNDFPLGQNSPIVGYCTAGDTATIGKTLRQKEIAENFPANVTFMWSVADQSQLPDRTRPLALYAVKTNNRLNPGTLQFVTLKKDGVRPVLSMTFDDKGAKEWAKMTKANINRGIAIETDNFVLSCPTVMGEIPGGMAEITGNGDLETLYDVLSCGNLPTQVRIVEEKEVGR